MQVIPVLDLKGGKAVHAVRGDRANYRPLANPRGVDGDPLAALDAYLAIHPFDTVYVADLGAIMGEGDHDAVLADLREARPKVSLMVDNGARSEARARAWLAKGLGALVIGSESIPPPHLARRLDCVLSLDFRAEGFQGPPGLDRQPDEWPYTLIVMTLAKVGAGEGPDYERLAQIKALAGARRVFAAGGVRNGNDLRRLKDTGIAGVLVASCLHNGAVGAREIEAVV